MEPLRNSRLLQQCLKNNYLNSSKISRLFYKQKKRENVLPVSLKVSFNMTSGRNEVLIHATTWMKIENIMLGEISLTQTDRYCMIPFILDIKNRQIHRGRKSRGYSLPRGWGEEEMRSYCLMDTEFVCG